MANKTYTVRYRRKREGKTNYKKRLALIKSGKPRLVIRKSLTKISAQIVEYSHKGDVVLASATTRDLKPLGWTYNQKNLPSAYLLGLLIAKKSKEKKVKEAILDIGLNKSVPGSKIYAVLIGAIDNGLDIPKSDKVLPNKDRVEGKHIVEYSNKLGDKVNQKFSGYIKNGADPKSLSQKFLEVKTKITGA